MLKKRVITASILIPLVVVAILFLPSFPFGIISALFFLGAVWEWTHLAGCKTRLDQSLGFLLIPLVFIVLLATLNSIDKTWVAHFFPVFIFLFWIMAFVLICFFPKNQSFLSSKTVGIILGAFVLVPAWFSLVLLHRLHPAWVLYVMVLVWAADIGAYFVGKRFGKHKLAPKVSPGKTWEGLLGGLIAATLVSVISYSFVEFPLANGAWLFLSLQTVLFSVVGDLFESLFKRMRNLKDSGVLLPGHGGILDRIDSLTAALPIFTAGLLFYIS